jgi:hypothetical protein
MKVVNNSIIDTVQEFANVKFGVDLAGKAVGEQLQSLSFSETLKLVDAIKNEDTDTFSSIIDINVEEAYGSVGTATPSRATASAAQGTVANRRATITAQDAQRDSTGTTRTVAGGNKTATGAARPSPAPDMDGQQRQANAQTAGQAASMAAQNAQEIERLKQLSGVKK